MFLVSLQHGHSENQRQVKNPRIVPTFVPTVTNVTVSQGDLATLPCSVKNLGTRQVSWRRMGSDFFLTIGQDTWVQDPNLILEYAEWPGSVADWNLVFKEARLEDTGTYECQVIHTERITWRVRLNVIPKPVYRPAIALEGKEYVESGESVYLLCNTTEGSRVPDDVDWFKDGDKIDKQKYPHVVITKFRSKEGRSLISELIIERGRNTDSGTYICRSSLQQIASLEVTVLVADTSNVKREQGSGISQTTRSPMRGENRAVTFTFLLGNALTVTLLVAFISIVTFNIVTT